MISPNTIKVLLLHDEANFHEPLTQFLREKYGYTVNPVASGSQALLLLEASGGRYDVILVKELLSGGLTGIEILKEISTRYPDVATILFTGPNEASGLAALRIGAYHYLHTSFNPEELGLTIRNAAEYVQARRERKILAALNKVSAAINSTHELGDIFRLACQAVVELWGVDHSGLVMFEADYAFGRVEAEYPTLMTITQESIQGSIIPMQGVPAQERLVYHKDVLNFSDVTSEASLGNVRDTLIHFGIRSILIVPIIIREQVVGSFSLDAISQLRTFSGNDIELCQSMANQLGVAIENARLFREEKKAISYLESLYELSSQIMSSGTAQNLLENVLDGALHATGAQGALAFLFEDQARPRVLVQRGRKYKADPAALIRPNGVSIHVLRTGRPYYIPNIATPGQPIPPNPGMQKDGIMAAACLPMVLIDQNIGVLWVEFEEVHDFSEGERKALQLFATHSAIAYDNVRRMQELERLYQQVARARQAAQTVAELSAIGDLQATMRSIVDRVKDVLRCDIVTLYSFDEEKGRFTHTDEAGCYDRDHLRPPHNVSAESVLWRVIDLPEPYYQLAENAPVDALFSGNFQRQEEIQSALVILLRAGGQRMGALFINYRTPHHFNYDEIHDARLFADQAAVSIRNAQLHQATQEGKTYLESLYEVSSQIIFSEDPKDVLQNVVDRALHSTGAQRVLALLFEDQAHPQVSVQSGKAYKSDPAASVRLEGVSIHVFRTGEAHFIPDVAEPGQSIPPNPQMLIGGIKAAACLSMVLKGKDIGVLWVEFGEVHDFPVDERKALQLFANHLAIAYDNARRYEQVARAREAARAVAELSVIGDVQRTMRSIVDRARDVLRCDTVVLYSFDEEKWRFTHADESGCYDRAHLRSPDNVTSESVLWKVIDLLEPYYRTTENASEDDIFVGNFQRKEKIRSVLAIQLRAYAHRVGALFINYRDSHRFNQDELNDARLFADQAAIAFRNGQLFQKIQQDQTYLELLYQASSQIISSQNPEHVPQAIVDGARLATGARRAVATLFDERDNPTILAESSIIERLDPAKAIRPNGISIHVLRSGKPVFIPNVSVHNPHLPPPNPNMVASGTCAAACLPMRSLEKNIGVLWVEFADVHPFSKGECSALQLFANQSALAYAKTKQNEVLARQADELQRTLEELKELDRRKTRSFSNVSHELIGPLHRILACIQNLLDNTYGSLTNPQREPLEEAQSDVRLEIRQIKRLLDLAVIEEGIATLELQSGSILKIIHEVINAYQRLASEKHIIIASEIQDDDPLNLVMDSEKVKQTLTNLIENALKFTPEGGTITVSALNLKNHIEVRVKDTGIGIAEDQLEKIFGRLYQVDNTPSRPFGGLGIGLYMAKTYIEMHGGRIWAKSILEKGSTFFFTLPKDRKE